MNDQVRNSSESTLLDMLAVHSGKAIITCTSSRQAMLEFR